MPVVTDLEEVKEDLNTKGFEIIDLARMYRKSDNGDRIYMPLILAQLPRSEQSIEISNIA